MYCNKETPIIKIITMVNTNINKDKYNKKNNRKNYAESKTKKSNMTCVTKI